jgi:hypothetical protein
VFPNVDITLEYAVSFEIDPAANEVSALAEAELNCQVHHRGCVSNFVADVDTLIRHMSPDMFFLAIAGTECTDISMAKKMTVKPGTSALHHTHSRTWFFWHEGMHKLCKAVGHDRVVHVCELPQCRELADERRLTAMAGEPIMTDATKWGHATRNRRWRTSPVLSIKASVVPHFAGTTREENYWDGSTWSPAYSARNGPPFPVVLRRYWPVLVERACSRITAIMQPFEKITLDSLRIKTREGELAFAGTAFFIEHLGLRYTPLTKITDILPCEGLVCNVTGQTVKGQTNNASKCGRVRFCGNCSEAMRILGGGWHLHSATEVMTLTLRDAMGHWLGMHRANWWGWLAEPHHCGPACPEAPFTTYHK